MLGVDATAVGVLSARPPSWATGPAGPPGPGIMIARVPPPLRCDRPWYILTRASGPLCPARVWRIYTRATSAWLGCAAWLF